MSVSTVTLAEELRRDLAGLGHPNAINLFAGDHAGDLVWGPSKPRAAALHEFSQYLLTNIYSYSAGSRIDGINELEYIVAETGDAQLKELALERLRLLSNTDPDVDVRRHAGSILHAGEPRRPSAELRSVIEQLAAVEDVPEFVEIPAGAFVIGTDDDRFYPAERGQHTLTLPRFAIGRDLVTVQQYAVYLSRTKMSPPPNWMTPEWLNARRHHPVTEVTWHDAALYCRWLTALLRVQASLTVCEFIRLPTEAEWEKAARGTDGRLYPWGNTFDPKRCNIKATGIVDTTRVGAFSPSGDSPFGCRDMVGNAREWTLSLWGPSANVAAFGYPYTPQDGRESEAAPDSIRKVVRGGGYYYDDNCSNCVVRNRAFAHNRHGGGGFRVVRAEV